MDAFRDHGVVGSTITTNIGAAEEVISGVEQAGIELRDVTAKLLADGIASFQRSSIALLKRLTQKAADLDVELVDGS
jgi:transaldolase/glucose-6-phosphate isomerase